jgi:hypothetical protein
MGAAIFNLLIFPLIGGYYIVTRSERFKYLNQRLDTQAVLFNSVIAGIPLLLVTLIITAGVSYILPSPVEWIKENLFPVKNAFLGTCALSFVIAVFGTKLWNRFIKASDAIEHAIEKIGNELELLFSMSCIDSELIQITLKNDKVYIGWVEILPKPSQCPYVKLVPLFSGYRDENKELKITTDYSRVYSEYMIRGKIKDISDLQMNLVVLVNEIISASRFDFEIFEKFESIAETKLAKNDSNEI